MILDKFTLRAVPRAMITTVTDLVAKLGGNAAVAEMFRVGPTAVCNAKARGRLPHRWRLPIQKIARQKRWRIDPALLEDNP